MRSHPTRRIRRRAAAASFTGVAGVVVLASAAFGCTMIMGVTKIANPTNGSYIVINKDGTSSGPGVSAWKKNTIKVSAWELPPGAEYELWFVWPGAVTNGTGCHTVDSTTGMVMKTPAGVKLDAANPMRANSAGMLDRDAVTAGAQPYKAVVPKNELAVRGGTAQICGREIPPWNNAMYESATQHVNLTIL